MVSYFKFHCKAVSLCYLLYVVCAVTNHEQQFEPPSEFFAGSKTILHRQKREGILLAAVVGALASAGVNEAYQAVASTFKGVDGNQCKYSITHRAEITLLGNKGFDIEWETEDGDINEGTEILDTVGSKTDTGHERISSAAYLKTIRFNSKGNPCVTAIAINCGDQAYSGGGQVFIDFEDLKSVFIKDGNEGSNDILSDAPTCVRFGGLVFTQKIRGLEINANIFECGRNREGNRQRDRGCIQRNLALIRKWY